MTSLNETSSPARTGGGVAGLLSSQPLREGVMLGARLVLGAVMLVAGIQKLRLPWAFLEAVYAYELTGPLTGALVAAALPWMEVLLGLLLLSGLRLGDAFKASLLLLTLFVVAQLSVVARGLDAPCACFGGPVTTEPGTGVGFLSIFRTSLLAILAGGAAWLWRVRLDEPRP